jgi:hypothetical protein
MGCPSDEIEWLLLDNEVTSWRGLRIISDYLPTRVRGKSGLSVVEQE